MTLEGLLHRVCFEAVRPTAVPDVRIRTHKELQTHSEEHQRVLSLLPSSVRSRLLSAGTLSSLQQSGARDTAQSSLSQEAAKGIVLTTHGREQALARHLADALAWQFGATSVVVCSTTLEELAFGKQEGALSSSREESSRGSTSRRAHSRPRLNAVAASAEAYKALTSALLEGAGADGARRFVFLITQDLLLSAASADDWLKIAKGVALNVPGAVLSILLVDKHCLGRCTRKSRTGPGASLSSESTLSSLVLPEFSNRVSLPSDSSRSMYWATRRDWKALVDAAQREQEDRKEQRILRANVRRLSAVCQKLDVGWASEVSRIELEAWPPSMRAQSLTDARAARLVGLALHYAAPKGQEGHRVADDTSATTQPVANVQPAAPLAATHLLQEALLQAAAEVQDDEVEADVHDDPFKNIAPEIQNSVLRPDQLGVDFKQVGSLEQVKAALEETVLLPLRRPDLFTRGNLAKSCSGVLLYGPPGTGKTIICRALAAECDAHVINVTRSLVTSKWFGETEKTIRAVFAAAEELAPTVIVVDEIDSMLTARSDSAATQDFNLVNEFLSAWDGVVTGSERVVVIGTTNRPDRLDEAVLRRMPRKLLVDLPDEKAREAILGVLLHKEVLDESVDVAALAASTPGFSGSDLKNLCLKASIQPVHDLLAREAELNARTNGRRQLSKKQMRPIAASDFEAAKKAIRISVADRSEYRTRLAKWHEQFGEGATQSSVERIGF